MKKFDVFVWASDFEDFTGEGMLARCFVEKYYAKKNILKIHSNSSKFFFYNKKIYKLKNKPYANNFLKKYFYLLKGLSFIWYYHFKGKKTLYINYLPLWNFLLFILLPSETVLGPITGSVYNGRIHNVNSFIRKIIFPIFYFIAINVALRKYKNLIFSTENLRQIVPKKFIKKCLFNFCLLFYKNRKLKKKDIDFIFYYRNHPQKANNFHKSLIKKLSDNGFKIIVVGDFFMYKKIKNYINLPRKSLLNLLDKTKFSVGASDNFYSLFFLDCLSCNVKFFYDIKLKPERFLFSHDHLKSINFNELDKSYYDIIHVYNNYKNNKLFKYNINNIQHKIDSKLNNFSIFLN